MLKDAVKAFRLTEAKRVFQLSNEITDCLPCDVFRNSLTRSQRRMKLLSCCAIVLYEYTIAHLAIAPFRAHWDWVIYVHRVSEALRCLIKYWVWFDYWDGQSRERCMIGARMYVCPRLYGVSLAGIRGRSCAVCTAWRAREGSRIPDPSLSIGLMSILSRYILEF